METQGFNVENPLQQREYILGVFANVMGYLMMQFTLAGGL
jgi:hypothetical protein